jgi:hypothetical protein
MYQSNNPRHGLTLRGGNLWPDEMAAAQAGLLPMPELLIGPTSEQQAQRDQEAKTAQESVCFWDSDAVRQHRQDIHRANLTDEDVEARALAYRGMMSLYPGSNFQADAPPFDASMDLALDDIVAEECAEVIQEVCKVRRFGMVNHVTGVNNKVKLETEIGQLLAAIERLSEAWSLSKDAIRKAAAEKYNAIEKWAPYYERNKNAE